jgi:hypothetical protein
MHYEVDVIIPTGLNSQTRRFLDSVQRSANRVVRFAGDSGSTTLTVEVAGMCRDDAVRAAAGEVVRIFPACRNASFGEPRQT